MDILDILKKDHRTVMDILDKLESSTTRAEKTRQSMFEKLKQELIPHMFAEENYFYQQILDNTTDPEQRQGVLEGIEEHQAAKTVLSDIESLSFSDERWQPDIMVLKELLKHHIKEEESNIFDAAEDVLEDLDQVGQDFISMKKEAKVSI
jgi:hemerythrin-like domain-containing protein